MYKFIADTDGLIKLAKAGMLAALLSIAKCTITRAVYEEVLRGKEKLYEDAFIVEALVRAKKIVVRTVTDTNVSAILGKGEQSTYELFKKHGGDAIISDDRAFLSLLEREGIPFITPANAIVLLSKTRAITNKEAVLALGNIQQSINPDEYNEAKKMLGG